MTVRPKDTSMTNKEKYELRPMRETWFVVPPNVIIDEEKSSLTIDEVVLGPEEVVIKKLDEKIVFRAKNFQNLTVFNLMMVALPVKVKVKPVVPKVQLFDALAAPITSERLEKFSG